MHDAAIIGLGAMGSAAAWQLAARGQRVVGFDRFHPPHSRGSSHGESRIIRVAYFEHPSYVPLLQRAWELWRELEQLSGAELLIQCGGLMVGHRDGVLVQGALGSAMQHGLEHRLIAAAELQEGYPQYRFSDWMQALWEPQAGCLRPEDSISAMLALAEGHGAQLRYDSPVERIEPDGDGYIIRSGGAKYRARRVLLSCGAWLPELQPELRRLLRIERQIQFFVRPPEGNTSFAADVCPISIWEYEAGRFFYTLPEVNGWVKVCLHHQGQLCSPETLSGEVSAAEFEQIAELIERYIPALAGRELRARVCMYSNTADEHFLIDQPAASPGLMLLSACSGHGFKFAPVMGEIAADLLTEGSTRHDISLFARSRLES